MIGVRWLGKQDYSSVLRLQLQLLQQRLHNTIKDTLLVVEHHPVYTIGRRKDSLVDILVPHEKLQQQGVQVHFVERGGNVTFHGPGQLVIYPILYLGDYQKSVRWYINSLETVVKQTLAKHGINSGTHPDVDTLLTGVWVGPPFERKIAAVGLQLSRWVTMHGISLNVNVDLSYYKNIVSCGIKDPKYSVTSMQAELKKPVCLNMVAFDLVHIFGRVFDRKLSFDKEQFT